MRILLIIPDLDGGGAQKVVLTLAQGLARRGHEIHVLLMEHLIKYDVPPEIVLHSLTKPGQRMSSGWLGKRLLAYKLRRWLRTAEKNENFDLIVANLPFASEIVFLARIPHVWHHIHNSLSAEIGRLSLSHPRKSFRRLRRYQSIFDSQNLIAVSKGVAHDLKERMGLHRAKIVTMYNPFDFEEIRRLAHHPEPDLPTRPYIVHAGRFVRQKRHDILLDAYAASGIPHDLVLLTKEDPQLTELIRSRGLQDRVIVAGFRPNPFPWYANASALILSSDYEGFGNVLVEALACGTPVVSTDCPSGPSEILVGSLASFLSPCGDINRLAANLRRVIEQPPSIDEETIELFSSSRAIEMLKTIAKDL